MEGNAKANQTIKGKINALNFLSPVIDPTLSIEGACAEAKTVGYLINEIKSLLNNLCCNEKIITVKDILVSSSGNYLTDGGSLPIMDGEKYVLVLDGETYTTTGRGGFATFTADGFDAMVGLYTGTDKLWLYSSSLTGKAIKVLEFYHQHDVVQKGV